MVGGRHGRAGGRRIFYASYSHGPYAIRWGSPGRLAIKELEPNGLSLMARCLRHISAYSRTTAISKLRNTSLHREGSRAPTMRGGLWTCLSSGTSSPTEGAGHRAPVTLRTKSEALRHRTSAGLGAGQRHRPRLGADVGWSPPTEGAGRSPSSSRPSNEVRCIAPSNGVR